MSALRDAGTKKRPTSTRFNVVQCWPARCVLVVPLLPRLESSMPLAVQIAVSRRVFAFLTDTALVESSTRPQAWFNSSAVSRHASFS